jgi:recombination protein RecA
MAKSKKKTKAKKDKGQIELVRKNLVTDILKEVGPEVQLLGAGGLAKQKIRGVISTQAPGIDAIIGRGGIPLSRLTMISGPEGSGKTTLALHIVAECQRQNGVVIYMDKEYKLDVDYAGKLGVKIDDIILSQPSYLENVYAMSHQIITKVAESRKKTKQRVPILIVLDSMNAAIAKAQYDGKWDDQHYAPQARVHSECLPKLIPLVHKEDVALLFISQIRKNIGVQYGNDESTSGGKAPRFYASLILEVRYTGAEKEGDSRTAHKTKIVAVKNQIAPPFKKTEFKIRFGKGIDKMDSLVWHCTKLGLIEKSGAWFSFKGTRLGQGINKSAETLRKNKELRKEINKKLRKEIGW